MRAPAVSSVATIPSAPQVSIVLLQRTFQGLEYSFKAPRSSRVGGAAFLLLWLAFWILGEVFAGGILLWGAWSLITGQPTGAGRAPLELAPALCTGLFLLAWLAFWTLGGVLAGREFLRLVFGRERISADASGVKLERHFGLFTSRDSWPRNELRRFYATPAALSLETTRGAVDLTTLGSIPERDQLATELNNEFGLAPQPSADGLLPKEWREITSPEGEKILVRDPAGWRKLGLALLSIVLLFALVTLVTIHAAWQQPGLRALAAIMGTATVALSWAAHRVTATRKEWVLDTLSLHFQRRTRGQLKQRTEAKSLHLLDERDSDGDPWYRLIAVETTDFAPVPHRSRAKRMTIGSRSGDPTDLRNLARWLQSRTRTTFTDHTTSAVKQADLATLTRELAEHGRLGRWVARLLAKSGPR